MTVSSDLEQWIVETARPGWIWHAKYLSANDTYAKKNVHQGGPYVSKELLRAAFPVTTGRVAEVVNPDHWLHARIDSHSWADDVRLIWYNSRIIERRPNGRDEARITNWGGGTNPLVEPSATGALVVFAFKVETDRDANLVRIWVARDANETDRLLELIGDVEPGRGAIWSATSFAAEEATLGNCALSVDDMPRAWVESFPSGEEIVDWVLRNRDPWRRMSPDDRLLKRRDCEYDVFRSVESVHALPRASSGFASVEEFVAFANAVTNRRKSRAGRSLELHTRAILAEEHVSHSWTPETEGARRPDFIFPSIERYLDTTWPAGKLRMLAAKTTCKDRWRQILNEADRIPVKHLLTLQEGVSQQQFEEMTEENVILVVPRKLIPKYPDEVQPSLLTLELFIAEAGALEA